MAVGVEVECGCGVWWSFLIYITVSNSCIIYPSSFKVPRGVGAQGHHREVVCAVVLEITFLGLDLESSLSRVDVLRTGSSLTPAL
jgi:hypothetical protein